MCCEKVGECGAISIHNIWGKDPAVLRLLKHMGRAHYHQNHVVGFKCKST